MTEERPVTASNPPPDVTAAELDRILANAKDLADNATRLALAGSDPLAHAAASSAQSHLATAMMTRTMHNYRPRYVLTNTGQDRVPLGDVPLVDTSVTERPR